MKQQIKVGSKVRVRGVSSDAAEYDEGTVIELVSAGFTNSSARVTWQRAGVTYLEMVRQLELVTTEGR